MWENYSFVFVCEAFVCEAFVWKGFWWKNCDKIIENYEKTTKIWDCDYIIFLAKKSQAFCEYIFLLFKKHTKNKLK